MVIHLEKDSEFTGLLLEKLREKYKNKKRKINEVHVSDIIPSNCIRRQFYSRIYPEMSPLNNESVHHFIRGESSEFVITSLADMGVAQNELKMDGIIAHPDIMNNDAVIELKDTVNGRRFDYSDDTFRSYLRQLLYYLTITGIEKGIISIRYNVKELKWLKRDNEGDYFFRPFNAKGVGIESWKVVLPRDDIARELLKNEMIRRKKLFLEALANNDPSNLPVLPDYLKYKCKSCEYFEKCSSDVESDQAKEMKFEKDLLDIDGFVRIKKQQE